MSKIVTAIQLFNKEKGYFFAALLEEFAFLFPDKMYLKLLYRFRLGRRLNLKNPLRFTEKLQWLKLYYHNPICKDLVDKAKVKKYIADWIGEEHVIPTYGIWDKFDEIDFDKLPDQFVLKTTNGGGGNGIVICDKKKQLDKNKARNILEKSLRQNIFEKLREWPYKGIDRRILAEKYMEDEYGELRDYKFYCFDGVPKCMFVASNRYTNHNFSYFDMEFNRLSITSVGGRPSKHEIQKPKCFNEMKIIASRLSKGFPHVRVDLYACRDKVFFGELTFFDLSGYDNFSSDAWDLKFGSWLRLPDKC